MYLDRQVVSIYLATSRPWLLRWFIVRCRFGVRAVDSGSEILDIRFGAIWVQPIVIAFAWRYEIVPPRQLGGVRALRVNGAGRYMDE